MWDKQLQQVAYGHTCVLTYLEKRIIIVVVAMLIKKELVLCISVLLIISINAFD